MKHFIIFILFTLFSVLVEASIMNIPDTYGLSSDEMGSAKAMSLFSNGFSSAYFNPSGLAISDENNISLNYIYAKPQLKLEGDVAFAEPNEVGMLGLKISMSNLFSVKKNLVLGMILGVDKNFSGLLSIKDGQSDSGEFIRYGRGQMLLITSFGVEPVNGLYLGGGAYISVKSEASVLLNTTLSGNTTNESIELRGKTGMSPILGMLLSPGRVFRTRGLDLLTIGFSYRGKSDYTVRVKTNAVATVGGSPLASLPIDIIFLDAFVPQTLTLGIMVSPIPKAKKFSAGIQSSYAMWNELDKEIRKKDVVKDELGVDFKNIFTYGLGCKYTDKEALFTLGYSYEPTPLKSTQTGRANLVDATRHILGFGAGYNFKNIPALRYPLTINVAYQLHIFTKRNYILESADQTQIEAETSGYVNALGISATLQF